MSNATAASDEKPLRPLLTKADVAQYAYQAGFQQVQSGVTDLLNDFVRNDLLGTSVGTAVINAGASHEKSLRLKHAEEAIRANHLIVKGHYQ